MLIHNQSSSALSAIDHSDAAAKVSYKNPVPALIAQRMTALARRLRRSRIQLLRNALARCVDDAADLFRNIGNSRFRGLDRQSLPLRFFRNCVHANRVQP